MLCKYPAARMIQSVVVSYFLLLPGKAAADMVGFWAADRNVIASAGDSHGTLEGYARYRGYIEGKAGHAASASIWAEADATFTATTNTSSIIFATQNSGVIAETMKLSNTNLQLSPSTGNSFAIYGMGSDALNIFSGGTPADSGGGISFYGNASTEFANDIKLRSLGNSEGGDKVAWYHADLNRWDWRGVPFYDIPDITIEPGNDSNSGVNVIGYSDSIAKIANSTSNGLFFQLKDNGGTTTHMLRSYGDSYIDAGNVGIGTKTPKSKMQISDGDIYIEDINKGIIMKSPSGQCWRVTVGNAGLLTSTVIACPS